MNDFTIHWDAPSDHVDHVDHVDHYEVTIFEDGKVVTRTVDGDRTSLHIDGETKQTIYQVRVTAADGSDMGSASEQITVEPVLPGAPVDVHGYAATGGGVTVDWSKPARTGHWGVDHYEVRLFDKVTGEKLVHDVNATGTARAFAGAGRGEHLHRQGRRRHRGRHRPVGVRRHRWATAGHRDARSRPYASRAARATSSSRGRSRAGAPPRRSTTTRWAAAPTRSPRGATSA